MKFDNYYLYKIVEEYKDKLQEIGYDITADNFEYLVKGFIKISNSMISDEIRAKPDVNIRILLRQILSYIEYHTKLAKKSSELDKKVEKEEDFKKKPLKERINERENKDNKIIESLRNKDYSYFSENKVKAIKRFFARNNFTKKTLDSFNKGELTEQQNQLIIELLK